MFQTNIQLESQKHHQIDYSSKIVLLGSCFAETIGEKFDYFKFQSSINPFGILFHPVAIEQLITRAINNELYIQDDVFFENEQWFSFDAHSKLNGLNQDEVLSRLNSALAQTSKSISQATHIFITLGTSWVYRHIETDKIVANCQKIPQKQFLKELLSVNMVSESIQAIIALLRAVNPDSTIIFTVSPVRHLKDGFVENTLSKSHLFSGMHEHISAREKIFYFPSYEIMMDELRDYRFYAEDMLHPNTTAVNYIWKRFCEVWLHADALKDLATVDLIQKGLNHRPFNPNTEAHHKFEVDLRKKIEMLQLKNKHISF